MSASIYLFQNKLGTEKALDLKCLCSNSAKQVASETGMVQSNVVKFKYWQHIQYISYIRGKSTGLVFSPLYSGLAFTNGTNSYHFYYNDALNYYIQ